MIKEITSEIYMDAVSNQNILVIKTAFDRQIDYHLIEKMAEKLADKILDEIKPQLLNPENFELLVQEVRKSLAVKIFDKKWMKQLLKPKKKPANISKK